MFALTLFCFLTTIAYKPVFCMHGINGQPGDCQGLQNHVATVRGNSWNATDWYVIDKYNGKDSFKALWKQVDGLTTLIRGEIAKDPQKYQEGYHLVCHSQGALLCRSIVESMDDHNVHTYVGLAGPHLGFYGQDAIDQYVGWLPKGIVNFTLDNAYRVLERPLLQKTFSPANLFHDPHQEDWHMKHNLFLPVVNNLVNHDRKEKFKANFVRLNKAVFYTGNMTCQGTDFDGGIEPWNAGIFGFFDPEKPDTIRPLQRQPLYLQDTFGMRTLDERGDLHVQAVQNISHNAWMHDFQLFDKFVLPWLV